MAIIQFISHDEIAPGDLIRFRSGLGGSVMTLRVQRKESAETIIAYDDEAEADVTVDIADVQAVWRLIPV